MNLRFCSIASGSSGNCYLVRTDATALLVDAGISGKKILEGLEMADTQPDEISALVLTHEHSDHVKSVRIISKKIPGLEVYSSAGTWNGIKDDLSAVMHRQIRAGDSFQIGDINIRTFQLSHDAAEPVGYSFESDGRIVTILTDSGFVTETAHNYLAESQLMVLESNHDVETLKFCSYPYNIKRRILSDVGHLSNETAGNEICRILHEIDCEEDEYPIVLLAHLSKETNFPEMAYQTIRNILEEHGYYPGRHVDLSVLDRDHPSEIYMV